MKMYHGTSEKNAREILRRGFDVAKAGARQKDLHGEKVAEAPGVFLTTDKRKAEWYAGPDRARPGLRQGGAVVQVNVAGRMMTDSQWWQLLGAVKEELGDTSMWADYSVRMASYREAISRAQQQGFAGFHEHQEEYLIFEAANVKVLGAYEADSGRDLVAHQRPSADRVAAQWLKARRFPSERSQP